MRRNGAGGNARRPNDMMPHLPSLPLTTALPDFPEPDDLLADLRTVLESKRLTNRGPRVLELEAELEAFWGVPAATVSSATLGLELAVQALGLRGRAILPSFTFVSTAHSLVRAGLDVAFADIDPETMTLDPAAVETVLDRRTSLVVPVDTYGRLADRPAFEALRTPSRKIVYDGAHAMGVCGPSDPPSVFGDATVFSFHATKLVSACEGGAVAADDPELVERVRRLSHFGFAGDTEVEAVGTNAKLSEVHAVFALHSLRHLSRSIARRKAVQRRYREILDDKASLRLLPNSPNGQFFPIRFSSERVRDRAFDRLVAQGIFVRKYFSPPLHELAPYRNAARGSLRHTEAVATTILCLPMHSGLEPGHADIVCEALLASLPRSAPRRCPQPALERGKEA